MVNDDSGRERQISRDRETIRNWADRHDVVPVREESGADEDRYRMVPEASMQDSHERVEWNHFFEDFEDGDRVVVYHGEQTDDPFEVAGQRDIATELDDEEMEERLLAGETVTSTVTETAVVESVVTEEMTVESELIDRETVDQRIVDSELVSRSTTGCRIADNDRTDAEDMFDTERYLAAVGGSTSSTPAGETSSFEGRELTYDAELDIEERWEVTRELTERFVVESEITGAEITEADSLEDYDLDVKGLHRTILDSGIIEDDLHTEDFLTEHEAESEITEDDRVTTSFTRQRTVEDVVVDHLKVHGDLTGGEVMDMELVRSEDVPGSERDVSGSERDVETADTPHDMGTEQQSETGMGTGAMSAGGATLTEEDVGKSVVDPTGDEVGTVTAVDEGANALYVDANPGLTDRIKTALGWGGDEEDDHRLDAAHVDRVTDDEVHLDHQEDMGEDADTSRRR